MGLQCRKLPKDPEARVRQHLNDQQPPKCPTICVVQQSLSSDAAKIPIGEVEARCWSQGSERDERISLARVAWIATNPKVCQFNHDFSWQMMSIMVLVVS